MDVLLDTSVLIDVLRSRNQRRELLLRLIQEGHSLSTTALNVAEVYVGIRKGEEVGTAALLNSLRCYELDAESGMQAGQLANSWARKGRTISLADAIVAAIAIGRDVVLMTDNRKDFPMPQLKLYPL